MLDNVIFLAHYLAVVVVVGTPPSLCYCHARPVGNSKPPTNLRVSGHFHSDFIWLQIASYRSKAKLYQWTPINRLWVKHLLLMLFSLCCQCLVYRLIILSRLWWSCAIKSGYTHPRCLSPWYEKALSAGCMRDILPCDFNKKKGLRTDQLPRMQTMFERMPQQVWPLWRSRNTLAKNLKTGVIVSVFLEYRPSWNDFSCILWLKVQGLFWKRTDLDDIVVAVFSVDGLHGTDVQATKHLSAGVHPHSISGTERYQPGPIISGDIRTGGPDFTGLTNRNKLEL